MQCFYEILELPRKWHKKEELCSPSLRQEGDGCRWIAHRNGCPGQKQRSFPQSEVAFGGFRGGFRRIFPRCFQARGTALCPHRVLVAHGCGEGSGRPHQQNSPRDSPGPQSQVFSAVAHLHFDFKAALPLHPSRWPGPSSPWAFFFFFFILFAENLWAAKNFPKFLGLFDKSPPLIDLFVFTLVMGRIRSGCRQAVCLGPIPGKPGIFLFLAPVDAWVLLSPTPNGVKWKLQLRLLSLARQTLGRDDRGYC